MDPKIMLVVDPRKYEVKPYVSSWSSRKMYSQKLYKSSLSWRAERANSKGIYHDSISKCSSKSKTKPILVYHLLGHGHCVCKQITVV